MRVLRVKRPKRVDAGPPVRAFFTRRGRATPAGSRAPHRGSCPRRARVDPGRIRQRSEDLAVLAVSRRVVPSWSDRGSAESTPRAYESYRERHARLVRNGSIEVERLEAAAAEVNDTVAAELLQRINEQLPEFLEKVVLQLLVAMGYAGSLGRADHLGGSGDEGVDRVVRQDALGLDRIYVQAKRYSSGRVVGRPDIQGFVSALQGAQAT